MKKVKVFIISSVLLVVLSGCGFQSGYQPDNVNPYPEQLEQVQRAVDQFEEQSGGLLPIKNRDQDVDQFIKYPIDFMKIVPAYMGEVPSNSFEAGGIYQYIMWDVEENPTVKLVDLRATDILRDLNFRRSVNGFAPIAETLGEGVYSLDYEKMGYKSEITVPSPYSNTQLPLVAIGTGEIFIDYSIELYTKLQELDEQIEPGTDIRYLLIDDSPIVPAYSLPYTVNDENEPVYMLPE
ncbi:hypothetical protein MKY84_09285 [Chryseomicrobium sp. FSL W7-1435]|uniref:LptM family lipoprotein n=1 Tax=Chryseomicrobium sp. FSL W7-1435 TaxID=2921704 RepID=UPI00315AA983